MKNILATVAVLCVTSTTALASTDFPVRLVKDGVSYNCATDVVTVDGVQSRRCIRTDGGASKASKASSNGFLKGGLGGGGTLAIIVITLAAIGTLASGSDSPTVGTN